MIMQSVAKTMHEEMDQWVEKCYQQEMERYDILYDIISVSPCVLTVQCKLSG